MYRQFLAFILSLVVIDSARSQSPNLSSQQRAWLMHVIDKTEHLRSPLGGCIHFNRNPLFRLRNNVLVMDYAKAEAYFVNNPDSLFIDFDCLKKHPHGLLAETAVKLALWELTSELTAFNSSQVDNLICTPLQDRLIKQLPENRRSNPRSKGSIKILNVVMNPSLPVAIKIQQLTELKLTSGEQKRLLEAWSAISEEWASVRSQYYYAIMCQSDDVLDLKMTASGEGSGTAGLLYEYEPNLADSTKKGYGKGIGLFTYKYAIRKDQLITLDQSVIRFDKPSERFNAIHCSLWGVDSNKKSMIVVTANNKSYQLFSHNELLSPDPKASDGISYLDRIQQMTDQKINKPLSKLNQDAGLSDLLQQEYAKKSIIEEQIHQYEAEVDSLLKMTPQEINEIEERKVRINSLLGTLSDKEQRISELGRKIAAQIAEVEKQKGVVDKMRDALGVNPQSWRVEEGVYQFADSTYFDSATQDLIFAHSAFPSNITVRLVSAAITLQGRSHDEIQLMTCLINVPQLKVVETVNISDSIDFVFYYHPDEIKPYTTTDSLLVYIERLNRKIASFDMLSTPAKDPVASSYSDFRRELEAPLTPFGKMRSCMVSIAAKEDGLHVIVEAGTDPVPTRLSRLSEEQRNELNIKHASVDNNKILAKLRAEYLKSLIDKVGK